MSSNNQAGSFLDQVDFWNFKEKYRTVQQVTLKTMIVQDGHIFYCFLQMQMAEKKLEAARYRVTTMERALRHQEMDDDKR